MVIDTGTVNRIGVYFFYDAQGIVDEYVFYYLEHIRPCLRELYIVCNGAVEETALHRFQTYAADVLVRENRGLDVEAYKASLNRIGFERLGDYDELILMNATVYGPLTSFVEMFSKMDAKDLDFWGITSHASVKGNPFPQNGLQDLPEHLQSYFLAVRQPILRSPEYRKYWGNIPDIQTYADSISHYECTFTRHFSSLGFQWASYTGTENMAHISPQPVITMPMELVRDYHCPIIKRRSFFQDYGQLLYDSNGDPGRRALDYIQEKLDYPADLIWENLLRTCNHEALRESLHLNYILPAGYGIPYNAPMPRTALWIHIHYLDMAEECLGYARMMPPEADVLVTTNSAEKKTVLQKLFSSLTARHVKVICVENRGRDNSAFLIGCAPYWQDYDVVCFAHDKKIRQLEYEAQGRTFSEHCFQNTLASGSFVWNVIQTFQKNPRMGLLCPPPPYASVYYNAIGIMDWGPNFDNTRALYDRLGLTAPISREYMPVAPFGFVFWFRPQALKALFTHGWRYEDFPPEPVEHDGSFLHAVERIIPFAAQQEGYYSAWLLSDRFASVELTSYHYMLRQLNLRLIPVCRSEDFQELRAGVERLTPRGFHGLYFSVKHWLKTHVSDGMYQRLKKLKNHLLKKQNF